MTGLAWVVSYIILSVAVVWLSLAVFNVYRQTEFRALPQGRWVVGWPSEAIKPGQALPTLIGESLVAEGSYALEFAATERATLFVLTTPVAPLAYAAAAAAHRVAEAEGLQLLIGIEAPDARLLPEWVHHLGLSDDSRVIAIPRREFRRLRLTYTPTTGIVIAGVVRDLVAGLFTPTDILRELATSMPSAGVRFRKNVELGYG